MIYKRVVPLRGVLNCMLCKVEFAGRIMVRSATSASAVLPWAARRVNISKLYLEGTARVDAIVLINQSAK